MWHLDGNPCELYQNFLIEPSSNIARFSPGGAIATRESFHCRARLYPKALHEQRRLFHLEWFWGLRDRREKWLQSLQQTRPG